MSSEAEWLVIGESKHGKGIFAADDLSKGFIVCKISGSALSFRETIDLADEECYCLQVGEDDYLIPDTPFYYSNHSCNPNCGINENLELVTICDIIKGEELCWDYSTSVLERHWTMKCNCGEKNCRNIVTDFDLLPFNVQMKYLKMKIVMPFIRQNMTAHIRSKED